MIFLTKSTATRDQELSEAYRTMQKYLEALNGQYCNNLMLSENRKLLIGYEIKRVSAWLREHGKEMKLKFEEI